MSKIRNLRAALVLGLALIAAPAAQASVGFGVHGGWSFPANGFNGAKSAVPYFGFELLAGIAKSDAFQLGAFYDNTKTYWDSGATGETPFIGGVVRIELQALKGFFVDFKVGSTHTDNGSVDSDNALGFGVGLGYRIALGKVVSLKPRFQYRSLPANFGSTSNAQSMMDGSLLLAFLF